ncbi:collagen-like protein [Myxococcaceae bacterium JPH2]|nr:collagen-like protein [Myxococcaceae bacterium JPH2]
MTLRRSLLTALLGLTWGFIPSLVLAATIPPGGGGTTPPAQPIVQSTRLLPLRGRLPGQANGDVAIRIKLSTERSSLTDITPIVLLFQETQTVKVVNEEFVAWVGQNTAGGLPPEVFADHPSAGFTYALEATPDTVVGYQPAHSVAYAMSLVPGSLTAASTSLPAVELSNRSGPALSASTTGLSASAATFEVNRTTNVQPAVSGTSNGTTGRGVSGVATATSGASYGVEGRTASIGGAGGLFVNEGGGDLLIAKNSDTGATNFRVDNQGRIFVNNIQVGLPGPQGETGADGDKGVPGDKGDPGPPGKNTFAVCAKHDSCIGLCTGTSTLVGATKGGCAVTSNTGGCTWGGDDGVCCVCAN